MKRTTGFFLLAVCLIVIVFLLRLVWSRPFSVDSGNGSSSSSLNLIVRVSPHLNKLSSASGSDTEISRNSLYRPYTSEEDLRGERTILFFADDDDPFSSDHDEMLRDAAAENRLSVIVYRVDFKTAGNVKLQYGVIIPDTFILLDVSGNRVKSIIHPSDTELQTLLKTSPR